MWGGGGGWRLPNKSRYGYVASAKPSPGKIFQKEPNAWANNCQKSNDQASFHYFQSAKIEIFQQVDHFFHSYQILHIFLSTINAWAKFTSQDLMPGHKLTPEISNVWTHTSVPALITPPHMNVNTLVQIIIIYNLKNIVPLL